MPASALTCGVSRCLGVCMADRKTYVANFFETELTTELGPTDLVAVVMSTGGLQSPAILVIEPDNPNQREVILFDGAFTDTEFRATSIASRYLGGSAQPGGLTHPVGSVVRSAPLAQHIQDLNDRIDADRLRITSLEEATVGTAKLEDGAVTTPKLADGAVTPPKIAEGFYPPTGAIVAYGGTDAPTGWLLCNGQAVSRTTYARLFAVIGTTYGAGDGSTTFNLPDLRQRFPLGKAASGTGSTLGATGGAIDHTHSGPSHTHSMSHSHSMSHTHTVNPPSTWSSHAGEHDHGGQTGNPTYISGQNRWQSWEGPDVHRHSIAADSGHRHSVDIPAFTSGGSSASNTGGSSASSTGSAGSGQTGSSNPPYLVVNYIIKT